MQGKGCYKKESLFTDTGSCRAITICGYAPNQRTGRARPLFVPVQRSCVYGFEVMVTLLPRGESPPTSRRLPGKLDAKDASLRAALSTGMLPSIPRPSDTCIGMGAETVGNPHRAQISQLEFFELVPLFKLEKHSSPSCNSRQQYLSQQYPPPSQ